MVVADAALTPCLLNEAAVLRAQLAEVVERSRDLRWHIRRRRLPGELRVREIRGSSGDDVGPVTLAIVGASLCVDCVARKTGVTKTRVERLLITVGRTLRLTTGAAPCDSCLNVTRVFRLA